MVKKCLIEDRHKEQAKNVEYCVLCKKKIGLSFRERLDKKVKKVPQEKKQKLLDVIWEGKTVGEAIDVVDPKRKLDSMIWHQIISDNIGSINYLRKEAV